MSVAGFKKQFYKASQLMSEKVGGAEGTKLDEDFKDLERRADTTSKAVVDVMNKTSEYIQPNPATRAKLTMLTTVSKMRGQENSTGYSQPESLLGECMLKYGGDLGNDSNFGRALKDVGETMKKMGEIKSSLDIDVKQNFIDPLHTFAEKDIKEIQHHLKKMEGRRLDYDYKKKRQGKIPDEEIRLALEKFHESKETAEAYMHNLLETDVEQVSQLVALVASLLDYHRQVAGVLNELTDELNQSLIAAQNRPKQEFTPRPRPAYDYGDANESNGAYSPPATSPPAYSPAEPHCRALYDFEPESAGELGFREGDIIMLTNRIDENWLEGTLRGNPGYFPQNYVEVVVPL